MEKKYEGRWTDQAKNEEML